MKKPPLLLTIILLTIFTTSSYLAYQTAKKITTTQDQDTSDTDFFMTDAIYTKYNLAGKIQSQIKTSKIVHQLTQNTFLFEKPETTIHNSEENPWHISAQKGKSIEGKTTIYLWGKVNLIQKAGNNNLNFDITTEALNIYPEKKLAKTSQPVKIIQDHNLINAIGAELDFKQGEVKLLSNIQAQYYLP